MSERKKFGLATKIIIVFVVVIVVGAVSFAGIEFTCTPWFCNRCHEMNQYYDTWLLCNHGPEKGRNMENCMKCHVKPGFLNFLKAKANGIFSLLFHLSGYHHVEASLPVICVREGCHNIETLDTTERTKDPLKTVKLDHKKHIELMEKIGTRYVCMPCHKNVAHGKKQQFMPDMKDSCFLCHGGEDIRYSNCVACHPQHPKIQGKLEDMYEVHKDNDVKCEECHIESHKANEIACLNCHDKDVIEGVEFKILGAK